MNLHSTSEKGRHSVARKGWPSTGAVDKTGLDLARGPIPGPRPLADYQSCHRQELDDEAQSDDCHQGRSSHCGRERTASSFCLLSETGPRASDCRLSGRTHFCLAAVSPTLWSMRILRTCLPSVGISIISLLMRPHDLHVWS